MSSRLNNEHLELSFPSDLSFEAVARETIASFARQLRFHAEQIDDMRTALGEAYTNATEHGNQMQQDLRITVSCEYDGARLAVIICDEGQRPYRPQHRALTIEEKVAGLGRLRGLGVFLMQQLADEVAIDVEEARGGNCCRLTWYHPNSNLRPSINGDLTD